MVPERKHKKKKTVEDSVGTVVQFTINEVSKGEQLCSSGEVNWSKGSNMIGYNTKDGR